VLHKASKIRGFHIRATDGDIGHIEDLLFDEKSWTVRYLVVDTSNWIGGRTVLISPTVIASIDSPAKLILVTLTRDAIERSPSVETAQIELIETMPAAWIM
jgi:hypothetical protein